MSINAKDVEGYLKSFGISQSWMKERAALIVAAKRQRGFSLFLILEAKPWQALGMEELNSLQSVQNQAKERVQEWAEG
jgi:hypothetical protein